MIICSCNQLTEKEIEEILLEDPTIKIDDIHGCLGCRIDCGTCKLSIEIIMENIK